MQLVYRYYSSGWLPFVPYIVLYFLAWSQGTPVPLLTSAFHVLHALHLIGFVIVMVVYRREIPWKVLLFFLAIGIGLIWVGMMLRYPDDPWEHLKRMFYWPQIDTVAEHQTAYKSPYFFAWTVLGWMEPTGRMTWVHAYGAAWMLAMSYQFYRFARCLGHRRETGCALALLAICIDGAGALRFRYFALSSAPLAIIAAVAATILLIKLSRDRRRCWFFLPGFALCLGLIGASHFQGYIWIAIATSAVLLVRFWEVFEHNARARFAYLSTALFFAAGIVFGIVFVGTAAFGREEWQPLLEHLNPWGGLSASSKAITSTAALDWVGLACGFLIFRRHRMISVLCLMPYLFLWFPPVLLPLLNEISPERADMLYRIVFIMPFSISLFLAVREGVRWALQDKGRGKAEIWSLGLILMAAWPGRFANMPASASPLWNLSAMTPTAQWFYDHDSELGAYSLTSDNASLWNVGVHLADPSKAWIEQRGLFHSPRTGLDDETLIRSLAQIPGNVPGRRVLLLVRPDHHFPAAVHHRGRNHVYQQLLTSRHLARRLDGPLTEAGWRRIEVPPFYYLYDAQPKK